MKTITITITVQDETAQTIKGSIMEQIAIANANKELAKKQINARVHELFDIRGEVMAQLNETVGADVFFITAREEKTYTYPTSRNHLTKGGESFAVKIGFKDGMYRNTCFNDWDLYIQTPLKQEVKYGEISYKEPMLEVIEMYLVKTEHNFNAKYDSAKIVHKIEDVSEIHKHLEKDYITYFTTIR